MRSHIVLLLLIGLSPLLAMAQPNTGAIPDFEFQVREESRQMDRATANAFVLSWTQADPKTIGKAWKRYAKNLGGKLKYDRRIDEYFIDDGEIKDLSDNTVDITTKIYNTNEGAELAIWFNLGVTYLTSQEYPQRYQAAEAVMRDFDSFVYAELLRDQLKTEEKRLRDLNKELKKIEREQQKEQRDIDRAQRDIAKAQATIEAAEQAKAKNQQTLEETKFQEQQQGQLIERMKAKIKSAR